jgi:hypothetical protein
MGLWSYRTVAVLQRKILLWEAIDGAFVKAIDEKIPVSAFGWRLFCECANE